MRTLMFVKRKQCFFRVPVDARFNPLAGGAAWQRHPARAPFEVNEFRVAHRKSKLLNVC